MRALVLAVLAMSPSAAAGAPSRVIDSDSVGSYRVTESRTRAIAAFGGATTSRDLHPFNLPQGDSPRCRTYWRPLELMIEYTGACSSTGRVRRVTVTGHGWRTRDGLRVGDTVARLKRLYRGAKATPLPSGKTVEKWGFSPLGAEWDLRLARPRSQVIVATRGNRIVGFELRSAELRSG